MTDLDALTERVNVTLKTEFDTRDKVVAHPIETDGSGRFVWIGCALAEGATLVGA